MESTFPKVVFHCWLPVEASSTYNPPPLKRPVCETKTLPSPSATTFKLREPSEVCQAKENVLGLSDTGTYPVCEAFP